MTSEFDLLTGILGRARRVVVTPHVLTEVSNLAGQLTGDLGRAAFEALARFTPEFVEVSEASAEIVQEPLFARLGLTDAAVVRAARGVLTVLTDDQALYTALAYAGVRVYNFAHLRAAA